ncbi:FIG045511: hypothetical antitoxin (to FIG022160: hypothetical toxin) [uncultured Candidatus Thioglobus sp.]|nr:FIG045511: hypothetical antitoxin (to FIG022160: hypothetical toxin) [uncultured Candidatus Thioglobus sp.]
MKVTTSEFDASEFLTDDEMMKDYLQVMFDENGVDGFIQALGDVAKAKGMSQIAKDANLGRQNLYQALSAGKSPKFDTINKVVEALGLKLTIV